MVGASLLSVKGNANSLAAAQFKLEKSAHTNGQKALVVALGDDEISQKMLNDFEKVPFKIVIASYTSALTAMADVVLPASNWLEQEGHYLSLDGNLQKAKRSLTPNAETRSTDEILVALAQEMGVSLDNNWSEELHNRTAIATIAE